MHAIPRRRPERTSCASGGPTVDAPGPSVPYPLADVWNLPRVAQYIATTYRDSQFPKGKVADLVLECEGQPPNFDDPLQPHRILADFGLPLYVTTNYDRFMSWALERRGCDVSTVTCRWNYETRLDERPPERPSSPDQPLVYHLHGVATNLASMLLTEDDYVDFLMEAQADLAQVVPCRIQEALGTTSLLFVGYGLNDWNFGCCCVQSCARSTRAASG